MSNNPAERAIGFDQGIRAAITWLHAEARAMNDPHARAVLNNAAFHLGVRKPDKTSVHPHPAEAPARKLEDRSPNTPSRSGARGMNQQDQLAWIFVAAIFMLAFGCAVIAVVIHFGLRLP